MKKQTIDKLDNYIKEVRYAIYDEEKVEHDCVKFSALLFHLENIVNIIKSEPLGEE